MYLNTLYFSKYLATGLIAVIGYGTSFVCKDRKHFGENV